MQITTSLLGLGLAALILLLLRRDHPDAVLLPTADMALVWAAHMALPSVYAADCARVLGSSAPWSPDYMALAPQEWAAAAAHTRALYEARYGEVYCPPMCAWVAPDAVHPLAAPGSPLAPLLAAWDTVDGVVSKEASMLYNGGGSLSVPPTPPLRAGMPALFAAWEVCAAVRAAQCAAAIKSVWLSCCPMSPAVQQRHELRMTGWALK